MTKKTLLLCAALAAAAFAGEIQDVPARAADLSIRILHLEPSGQGADLATSWQGAILKYRGRYYLNYENFHAVDDADQAHQNYDDIQAGSRVGYATGN